MVGGRRKAQQPRAIPTSSRKAARRKPFICKGFCRHRVTGCLPAGWPGLLVGGGVAAWLHRQVSGHGPRCDQHRPGDQATSTRRPGDQGWRSGWALDASLCPCHGPSRSLMAPGSPSPPSRPPSPRGADRAAGHQADGLSARHAVDLTSPPATGIVLPVTPARRAAPALERPPPDGHPHHSPGDAPLAGTRG
jgi:hypothetical protein